MLLHPLKTSFGLCASEPIVKLTLFLLNSSSALSDGYVFIIPLESHILFLKLPDVFISQAILFYVLCLLMVLNIQEMIFLSCHILKLNLDCQLNQKDLNLPIL